ncbi:hypothetical protein [Dendronalium sp. ChiSLP03b]|uniref:hypothetical protein n=1 Tax=Dendronalium sp. ChiSLP03b TaxID=3075381 RepID=UPI00391B4963
MKFEYWKKFTFSRHLWAKHLPMGLYFTLHPFGFAVAHGGNHATCFKSAKPPNAVAPQDRAVSPLHFRLF